MRSPHLRRPHRRPAALVSTLSAGVLVAGLGGCAGSGTTSSAGSTETPSPTSGPTSSPTSGPTATPSPEALAVGDLAKDPAARKAVARAVRALLTAGTGTVTVRADLAPVASIREKGSYDIDGQDWAATRTFDVDGQDLTAEMLTVDATSWMRMDAPGWGCWVGAGALQATIGVPSAGAPHPAPVIAASYLVGREQVGPGTFLATADLVTLVQLLSSKSLVTGELDPESDIPVPATVTLSEGVLESISVRVRDLLPALEGAGVAAEALADLRELRRSGGEAARTAEEVLDGSLEARFADVGAPVSITAPGPEEVLEEVDEATFEQDLRSCPA
ncbi:hypothetical protein NOK12_01910 [Nocardioides sp. OK12]|uniref:hypothetical protein n=1 Tax=Nocardioides sp. OK12 TaxID=2758661 RepID=UPI0021C2790D|nr:hypothetical protein [Nocardioides sp. OK12]GHJ57672.1 hypothetical protein NOK12_01910 [Nocardioides sp. OK12]